MRNPNSTSGKPETLVHSRSEHTGEHDNLSNVLLDSLQRPSNHIMVKHDDDTLEGLRYVVTPEPSCLRPVKSWTVRIDHWYCCAAANIKAEDILFIRILNTINADKDKNNGEAVIKDIIVRDRKIEKSSQTLFNAAIAAGVLINKIDAKRFPNINKILETYRLI